MVEHSDDDMFDLAGLIATPDTDATENSRGIVDDVWPANDDQPYVMEHALDWLFMFASWEDVARL